MGNGSLNGCDVSIHCCKRSLHLPFLTGPAKYFLYSFGNVPNFPVMKISASIRNEFQKHAVTVHTDGRQREVQIPSKEGGYGSSLNGGELLFLSLATCFCNDTYREAARRNVKIASVEVTVAGEFGKEGEAASNISYEVKIESPGCSADEIADLIRHVDSVAEIHNTLRSGIPVTLKGV